MISPSATRAMTLTGALALVLLVGQSFVEYATLSDHPNPFDIPATGIPSIDEGPFKATGTDMQADKLPWILDPIAAWPAHQRDLAQQPCGLWHVLAERYPLWAPNPLPADAPVTLCATLDPKSQKIALRKAGWTQKPTLGRGPARLVGASGEVILERQQVWELVLERRGLVVRRRSP